MIIRLLRAYCRYLLAMLVATAAGLPLLAAAQSVVTYHNTADRHGAYLMPSLTVTRAAGIHLDPSFNGTISGHVYAEPLYWEPPSGGNPEVIVATESNTVYALDAGAGTVVWETTLGTPTPLHSLSCGNIDPVGVTGTPVIDPATGTLYLDALIDTAAGPSHQVFALSLANGAVMSGWPINVGAALKTQGVTFTEKTQGQRGALAFVGGRLYVPFGGAYGDCLPYNGTVVEIQTSPPQLLDSWITRAQGGGIWAQGGVSFDGQSMFAATGNTFGVSEWGDGEAIVRLAPGLAHSPSTADFFAPTDWQALDEGDLDLGGTGAIPIDVATPAGSAPRILGMGKDGKAYLLNRSNLGGIGGMLEATAVSTGEIITGPAVYETPHLTIVGFTGQGADCPTKEAGGHLTALRVTANAVNPVTTLWCAAFNGAGAPIVTTTNGTAYPIFWVVGAEGDNQLHGFHAVNGKPIFTGGGSANTMAGLHHFVTILAAGKRLYVAADNRIYAFIF